MKLAISNLAWPREQEAAVAEIMRSTGTTGVELAPTKIWKEPLHATNAEISEYRGLWRSFGIEIVSLQSLLFERPDLELFAGVDTRAEMLRYLSGMIDLSAQLGARVLVFGSPRNRHRHGLSDDDASAIAIPFFRSLAIHANACGVTFCIEPNPPQYGCDWITTSTEGLRFVGSVAHDGLGLNLDAGGMTLANEDPASAIVACASFLRHFHISDPDLAPVGHAKEDEVVHEAFGRALRSARYAGWTSIEMISPPGNPAEAIVSALRMSATRYAQGSP